MKPSFRNFLLIFLLISGSPGNISGQQSTEPISALQKEAYIAFGKVTGFLLRHEPLSVIALPHLRITGNTRSFQWQGQQMTPLILLESQSKNLFIATYRADLNELFRKYLTGNGWKVESLSSDHYGEREYRVSLRAKKDSSVFDWIFTARDNLKNDWDMKLYILEKGSSVTLPEECSYADFFSKVLKFYSGTVKNVSSGNCFRVSTYDPPVHFEAGSGKYKLSITFYCQYGASSTVNGYHCCGELLDEFTSFLKEAGYLVKTKEDLSMPGWRKIIYKAGKAGHAFLFVYESESAASSGYAKIHLLK